MTTLDEIKSRTDIVELVNSYVNLKKSGNNFKANCPFHEEKTPSFIVTPSRQSWRCFGACATGGDIFSFIMHQHRVEFKDALTILADRSGVSIERQDSKNYDRDESLIAINKEAANYFQTCLVSNQGTVARQYLKNRGVNEITSETFQIGFSPKERDGLKSHLLKIGFDEEMMALAGIIRKWEDGNSSDFFRQRLIFPIHNQKSQIIGFGGRSLTNNSPKYINTPATPIFDKRSNLYALNISQETIRSQNSVTIVEGYMDAVTAHQFGFRNVVASMGTALTEQQVFKIRSMTNDIILALDPDTAGQEATLRSLESSWKIIGDQRASSSTFFQQRSTLKLKIAVLENGMDPDELIRKDPIEWETSVEQAKPYISFIIDALESRFNLDSSDGKTQALEIMRPIIQKAPFLEQDGYINKLSTLLELNPQAIRAGISQSKTPKNTYRRTINSINSSQSQEISKKLIGSNERSLDEHVILLILNLPDLKSIAHNLSPEWLKNSEDRELLERLIQSDSIQSLETGLEPSLKIRLDDLSKKALEPIDINSAKKAFQQCILRMEIRYIKEMQEIIINAIQPEDETFKNLENQVAELNNRIKELETSFNDVRKEKYN
ncbi:MAG: DNA primase [SAR202 cluster bacterium]|nr:DNA primase [SAR202 cluster bacterium]